MNYFRKFYEGADGGSGGGTQPTLDQLMDPNYKPPASNLSPEEIAAQQKLDDEAAQQTAAYEEFLKEAKNEDGTLKEGFIEQDGKVIKDPDFKPVDAPADDDEENDLAFYEDVNKLHGRDFKIEFPEGVEPLSPQGVFFRDKVIMETAVKDFDEYLAKRDPRSYAYMLHRQAGGSDEDFYMDKTINLPEYETFKDSTDVQVSIYKSSLVSKGLDPEIAQAQVDKAIKDGKLFEYADAIYKQTEKADKEALARIEQANQQAEERYNVSVNRLTQSLNVAIDEGKEMKFIIPDTEKVGFKAFVLEKIEFDNQTGNFLLVQPIKGDDLNRQLEAMYLLYKKGDLKGLIQREAQTQNTRTLKRTIDKSKEKPSNGDDPKVSKDNVPFGQIFG